MEGGILHYFEDIATVFHKTHRMLKCGGRLILDDFHPYRKLADVMIQIYATTLISEKGYLP